MQELPAAEPETILKSNPKHSNVNSFNNLSSSSSEFSSSEFSSSQYAVNSVTKVKKINNIVCLYTNADQFLNKRSEFSVAMEIYNPDIVGITEVKPKTSRYKIQESELMIENFDIFHNLEEDGRGLLLYVRTPLKASICEMENDFSEKLFVECKLNDGNNLLIGLIYRSSNDERASVYAEKLNDLFTLVSNMKATHKIIMGDFNYPQIDWNMEISKVGEEHIASKFLKTTKDLFFIQNQKTPTRYREGQIANILDWFLQTTKNLFVT